MTIFESHSEAETEAIAARLSLQAENHRTFLLVGELGAGKTAFTRGFAEGMGIEDPALVHSPTFSLINRYATSKGALYHVDLYRLESERDLYSIGLEELLDGHHHVVIEWADKLPWKELPAPVTVVFEVLEEERRKIRVEGM